MIMNITLAPNKMINLKVNCAFPVLRSLLSRIFLLLDQILFIIDYFDTYVVLAGIKKQLKDSEYIVFQNPYIWCDIESC